MNKDISTDFLRKTIEEGKAAQLLFDFLVTLSKKEDGILNEEFIQVDKFLLSLYSNKTSDENC